MLPSEFIRKMEFRLLASRFVAGETIDDAVRAARILDKKGIYSIINILGENVKDYETAIRFRDQYLKLINKLAAEDFKRAHIAVKPSQLGIEVSDFLYRQNLGEILQEMSICLPDSMVEIDRETHDYANIIKEVSMDFSNAFPGGQRLACQLNRKECLREIAEFVKAGVSIRLCKGTAYSGDIKDEDELRKRFLWQAISLYKNENNSVAATHDPWLLDKLKDVMGIQVLLGIENQRAEKLVSGGKEVGIYVPCGPEWWTYGKRRWKSIAKIYFRNRGIGKRII